MVYKTWTALRQGNFIFINVEKCDPYYVFMVQFLVIIHYPYGQ